MTIIDLWIPGEPATAGSKRHVGNGILVDSSGIKGKAWRSAVQDAALKAKSGGPIEKGVPLALVCMFYRARPKGHYNAKGVLRPKCQDAQPVQRPDALKYARQIEDSLQAVLYQDDSQITIGAQGKAWCDGRPHGPGARVLLGPSKMFETMLVLAEVIDA
ncbi:MAG: RusA family crossover junction endodeoxyribonuclease [Phycisphaerales bacterium JB064]